MGDFFSMIWQNIIAFLSSYHLIRDTLDILVIAFVIYSIIKLIRDSRAEQLVKGIIILAVAYAVSYIFELKTLKYFMDIILDNSLIILMIIFQPEIRRALEQAGHSRLGGIGLFAMNADETEIINKRWQKAISAACSTVEQFQHEKTGALIVFERTTKLGEIIKSGTLIDADPSTELIGNIFFNKAPLHDGAMIMRDGKVYAAGCILPLTDNPRISSELGTRHRAAVGMSENSDAMIVIVSEETGTVSLAVGGDLKRNFSAEALRIALENGILWDHSHKNDEESNLKKRLFQRRKSK